MLATLNAVTLASADDQVGGDEYNYAKVASLQQAGKILKILIDKGELPGLSVFLREAPPKPPKSLPNYG